MPRKVILDVDPGIDDAMAICLALSDPSLEVVAVTATGGNVGAEQATRNVQAIVEQLDPARLPRIGAASTDWSLPVDRHRIHGADGLGGANLKLAEHHHRHPADKVICDEVRAAPEAVTIVALGPLTNIAAAFERDPHLAPKVGHLIVMGGTVTGPGNVTPVAEFNIYCNPAAARTVFRSPVTKTLIPLETASQVVLTYDLLEKLPGPEFKCGALLEKMLPAAMRSYRQELGQESIQINDAVALVAAVHPELFKTKAMIADVETSGSLTAGMTVFDRRRVPEGQPNMEVAVAVDKAAVIDRIVRGLLDAA